VYLTFKVRKKRYKQQKSMRQISSFGFSKAAISNSKAYIKMRIAHFLL
jgi:hypothetical protein